MITLKVTHPGALSEAVLALEAGALVVYPTDTLYGLGADALSDSAVKKMYEAKGRTTLQPTHAIVADMKMAARYAHVTSEAKKLADAFLPGPLTLVLKKKAGIETGIAKGFDTFAIRIPNNVFCRALVEKFGGPITTSSANRTGRGPHHKLDEILKKFKEAGIHIDVVIDAGDVLNTTPSTIIDCSVNPPTILRAGAISQEAIERVLSL